MCEIVNNSAADCSISLQFHRGFEHMTPEVLQKFKVKGSEVRSQRDVTWAKIWQIMNNSAEDSSISIKFTTDHDHATPDLPQIFKVNGLKVKCHMMY